MQAIDEISVVFEVPSVETYRALRLAAGLSDREVEAASVGLRNTLFAVQLRSEGRTVAMGRVIGDGGCFFQVVDIAVVPDLQGQGLGKKVMTEILGFLKRTVPATAFVGLSADGEAHRLYEQFGFRLTAPGSVGMKWWADHVS